VNHSFLLKLPIDFDFYPVPETASPNWGGGGPALPPGGGPTCNAVSQTITMEFAFSQFLSFQYLLSVKCFVVDSLLYGFEFFDLVFFYCF
jgi:hypothetical protein